MRSIRLAVVCLFAVATSALAEFEGVLEMKVKRKGAPSSTSRTYLSKAGWRTEVETQVLPRIPKAGQAPPDVPLERASYADGPMTMTLLGRASEPDKVYSVVVALKMYIVNDVRQDREMARRVDEEAFIVDKLGPDSVAGYPCEKVLITSSKGSKFEGCAAEGIPDSSIWLSAMQPRGRGAWTRALRDAGVGQFLIRLVMHDNATKEETMRIELVRADRKPLPPSLFEIPAGYKERAR